MLEGVSNKDMLEGVSNRDSGLEGVSDSSKDYKGLSNSSNEQHPSNYSTNEQQSVSNNNNNHTNNNYISFSNTSATLSDFYKILKDVCGKDCRSLIDTYVLHSGILKITIFMRINTKKNKIDLCIKQKSTSTLSTSINKTENTTTTIRCYETEGVFDHIIPLSGTFSFYYHTRTKKSVDKSTDLSVLWIRIDPDMLYLHDFTLLQPDYMFVEQLLSDRSVFGQMDALKGLKYNVSELTVNALERVLNNIHFYYKIRVECMYILTHCNVGGGEGVSDKGYDYKGVNYKGYDYRGVDDKGLESDTNDYKGVGDKEYDYKGDNNSTNDYRGDNNSTDNYKGVNKSTNDYRGDNYTIDEQHPLNHTPNEQKGVNEEYTDKIYNTYDTNTYNNDSPYTNTNNSTNPYTNPYSTNPYTNPYTNTNNPYSTNPYTNPYTNTYTNTNNHHNPYTNIPTTNTNNHHNPYTNTYGTNTNNHHNPYSTNPYTNILTTNLNNTYNNNISTNNNNTTNYPLDISSCSSYDNYNTITPFSSGYMRLLQFFIRKYCYLSSTIVKSNDYNSFTSYFIEKEIIRSISVSNPYILRSKNINSEITLSFIINLLKYNDNSSNGYSDSYYIGSLVECIGLPLCSMGKGYVSDKGVVGSGVEGNEGVRYNGLEGVRYNGLEDNGLEGVSNSGLEGVRYNGLEDNGLEGVNNSRVVLEGVSNSIDKQQGVSKSGCELEGVSNSSNDYKGVSNSTNQQQGVSNSTYEQQGVSNNTNNYHPSNYTTYEQKGVNTNTNNYHPSNYTTNEQKGVNTNTNNYHPLNTSTNNNNNNYLLQALQIIERIRRMDLLFPSTCNILTCVSLLLYGRLHKYKLIDLELEGVISYLSSDNYIGVRLIAIEVLLCIGMSNSKVRGVIYNMIENEERGVRMYIIKGLYYYIRSIEGVSDSKGMLENIKGVNNSKGMLEDIKGVNNSKGMLEGIKGVNDTKGIL
ncbi:Transcription initiation factor TFIID subunit 2 [Hamiltosporidium tvaerminnensis]|nr:Transcription initiation factor TFIID subunit 2 [Hamiltosporidium tvaerminnensis]